MKNRIRLPLAALSLVIVGLLGACSNSTGPSSEARRSGYITSSTSLQVAAPKQAPIRQGVWGKGGKKGTAPTDSVPEKAASGYNVPAF